MEAIMSSPEQRRIIWDRRKALLDERTLLAEAKAEGIAEGLEKGRVEGIEISEMDSIRNLMEAMRMPVQKAMDILKIDPSRREKYAAMLK
jgi:flagellar biosynthesis/type III secretory pathway protein FliH